MRKEPLSLRNPEEVAVKARGPKNARFRACISVGSQNIQPNISTLAFSIG
jgi:hypothetical protein